MKAQHKNKRLLCNLLLGFIISVSLNIASANAQSIQQLEYYFDTDPGLGNGTLVTANANTGELTQALSLPITGLDAGFHSLSIRSQDQLGTWGLYQKSIFYVSEPFSGGATPSNIASAEYWFNTDPGQGNGNSLTISGNPSETTESFAIPLGTLDVGFHRIGIRTQNLDGIWSLYENKIFYVSEEISTGDPIANIAGAEFWFDTDPGFGNGTALAIAGSPSSTSQNFTIPLGNLDAGFHKIGIRTQNTDGHWSLYEKKVFYIFSAEDNEPPSALSEAEFLYDAELGFGSGTSAVLTATGNDEEYIVEIPTDMVTCNMHNIWLSIKNEDGNYSLYNIALDVDVFDDAPPTIVVYPDIVAELDANGQASITLADVNNGTYDDCELFSVELNQAQFDYTCANLGANTVTITATDAENKVSSQDVTITVVDSIDPVAISQDITVQLNASGNAIITPSQIENGSSDNCSIVSSSLDITSFDCSNLGSNIISYTVIDADGNTNSTTATVMVEDSLNPTVITQNITVQLDASGNATIAPSQIENGSTDNCSITSSSLDITTFDCSNLGANTVTLSVTDGSNNTGTATAIVTIEDAINPTVVTQNITVQLDGSGNATIAPSQIENGSTDNCSIASSSLDITSFDCSNLGANTVTLSVTDGSNNTGTATAIVTVEDTINPTVVTQNITVQLDASGYATIAPSQIEDGSTDNCSITSSSLDITTFDCSNLGANSVTLSVTDGSNNTGTATAIVTVEDSVNPTAIGQDISVDLAGEASISITANDVDNGSNDNCGFTLSIDQDTFTTPGDYPVVLTATDDSNNTNSVTVILTITDTTLSIVNEQISENSIKLFPVPADQYINISTNLKVDSLVIIDINGKILNSIDNVKSRLDISELPSGVYFMKFTIENSVVTKRIIKK